VIVVRVIIFACWHGVDAEDGESQNNQSQLHVESYILQRSRKFRTL
jgi:hypothetical protein